jgi:hypothetical protein
MKLVILLSLSLSLLMKRKIHNMCSLYIFLRPSGAEVTRVVLDQRMTDHLAAV